MTIPIGDESESERAAVEISVVIPCRNGAMTLKEQLDSLAAQQTEYVYEVIVANNGSTDSTADLVARYATEHPHVKLTDASESSGINVARNAGVRFSRGKYVLLCDADDVVHPGWIQAYGEAFAEGATCVGGRLDRELPDGTVLSRQSELSRTNFSAIAYPVGANCGFTRSVFEELGGFNESFAGGSDEIEFFWRAQAAGHPTFLVPGAVISYRVRAEPRELVRQYYRYGRGNARLIREFGTSSQLRRELLLFPFRWLRALAAMTLSRPQSARRRGGLEGFGFQLGMIGDSVSRSRTVCSNRLQAGIDSRAGE
ncbi:glycosyltransferase family 2 protein [Aeromicrobium sp. UC242_57]|uniref:glycosyltransferase family 2 protein n=1 Tax=Aeromicrobium sp. UC242_57 TaxID=3374624 RepID=UPI00379FBC59